MTCRVHGDPQPQIMWKFNGQGLPYGVRLADKNRTVVIDSVLIKYQGTYTCFARNRFGRSNSSVELKVEGKMFFTVSVV